MPSDDPDLSDIRVPRGRIGKFGAGLIGFVAVISTVMLYGKNIVSTYYYVSDQITEHSNPQLNPNTSPSVTNTVTNTSGNTSASNSTNPPTQSPPVSPNSPNKQSNVAPAPSKPVLKFVDFGGPPLDIDPKRLTTEYPDGKWQFTDDRKSTYFEVNGTLLDHKATLVYWPTDNQSKIDQVEITIYAQHNDWSSSGGIYTKSVGNKSEVTELRDSFLPNLIASLRSIYGSPTKKPRSIKEDTSGTAESLNKLDPDCGRSGPYPPDCSDKETTTTTTYEFKTNLTVLVTEISVDGKGRIAFNPGNIGENAWISEEISVRVFIP